MLGRTLSRGCIVSNVSICLCKNIIALGIPTGWSSHFFVSPAAHIHHMIKFLVAGPEPTEQVPLGRYGVIIRGQLASSNTSKLFFFFLIFSSFLSISVSSFLPVPCPISSLLWPNAGPAWAQRHSGHCLAVYSLISS